MTDVFQLETQNVRAGFDRHRRQLLRALNESLRTNDSARLSTLTLSYALLYSAWSEAQFMQVLHTPDAFNPSDIESIKAKKDDKGFAAAWLHFLEVAFSRVTTTAANVAPQRVFLTDLVHKFIEAPALLRNKIAHGQWHTALNRGHTAENPEITAKIQALEFTQVDLWFRVQHSLGFIIRDLLQSPKNAHFRDFWKHHTIIVSLLKDGDIWTLESKRALLRPKPSKARETV